MGCYCRGCPEKWPDEFSKQEVVLNAATLWPDRHNLSSINPCRRAAAAKGKAALPLARAKAREISGDVGGTGFQAAAHLKVPTQNNR